MVWGVKDFVVEHGIVKSKTKSDWVSSFQVLSFSLCNFVRLLGLVDHVLTSTQLSYQVELLITRLELSKVPIVVSLHLEEEDLCLSIFGVWNERGVEEVKDIVANAF